MFFFLKTFAFYSVGINHLMLSFIRRKLWLTFLIRLEITYLGDYFKGHKIEGIKHWIFLKSLLVAFHFNIQRPSQPMVHFNFQKSVTYSCQLCKWQLNCPWWAGHVSVAISLPRLHSGIVLFLLIEQDLHPGRSSVSLTPYHWGIPVVVLHLDANETFYDCPKSMLDQTWVIN